MSVGSIMGGGVMGAASAPRSSGPGLGDVVRKPAFEDRAHFTPAPKFAPRLTYKPAPKFEPRQTIDPTPVIEPRFRYQSDRVELTPSQVGMPSAVDKPVQAQLPWDSMPSENIYAPDRNTDVVIKRAHAPSAGTLLDVFI